MIPLLTICLTTVRGLGVGFVLMPMQAGATLSAHMTWQGFTPMAYGLVMGVNGVVIIVLQPVLTVWCARFDPTRVLVGAALLTGAGIAVHGLAGSMAVHIVAVVRDGVGRGPARRTQARDPDLGVREPARAVAWLWCAGDRRRARPHRVGARAASPPRYRPEPERIFLSPPNSRSTSSRLV